MSKPAANITEGKEPFIPYVEAENFPNELMEALNPYKERMGFIPNASMSQTRHNHTNFML